MDTTRQSVITRTAIIGIIANLVIASTKIIIGVLASSLAIISEGINNATDAGSAVLTLVGTKLSAKHPDEKHPFGYGRIEYLTGMGVGLFILFTGFSMFRESIDKIIHPETMDVTVLAIGIVAFSAIIKFALGKYTYKKGEEVNSDTLRLVGEDSCNDSYFSILTIVSSIIFLVFDFSLDAYVSLVFAFVVLKTGLESLKGTTADIIGTSGEQELAQKLYKEIRSTKGIISAVDMMLHNYGPEAYSGSCNLEMDHNMNVGEAYEIIHELQLRIMQEYNVVMVFGIYAVDNDSSYVKELRSYILEYVHSNEHILSYHALYLREQSHTIYVDFIVDYKLPDWEATRQDFISYMNKKYPNYGIVLTIETEFV